MASRVFPKIGKWQFVQAWSEIPDKKKWAKRDLDSERYVSSAGVIRTVTKPLLGICKPLTTMQQGDAATRLRRTGKLLRMWEHGELLFLHFSACCMNFKQPLRVSKAVNHWQQKYLDEFSKELEAQPPNLLVRFVWTKWIAGTNCAFGYMICKSHYNDKSLKWDLL